ncbi:MAG: putative toxin-antitoxin system toxin component, PIN family [Chloroflexia bacterium]|nr:putative toxin-antitoxin system toxin component, PIN family [Chloroflexia bacterium]
MAKVVLDAVVFVRALLNPRSPWGRLVFDHADQYRLVVSPTIVAEIVGVLNRPRLARRFSSRTGEDVAAVRAILASAQWVVLDAAPRISRDPKDDIYPATAAAAGAAFLVSEDRDLLDLRSYEGVAIVDAGTFLRVLAETGPNGV